MGISQAMGPDALRAGVVPDTASRPQSPFEGQLIFQRDTNQLLVYDGSAWVMIGDSDAPPGLQLIKTQAVGSAVSSVTITNCFSSDFDDYFISYTDGTMSSETNIYIELVDSNGTSSLDEYYTVLQYGSYSGTAIQHAAGNDTSRWTWSGGGSSTSTSLRVNVISPFLSRPTHMDAYVRYGTVYGTQVGYHNISASYPSIKIVPNTGTFTGGSVRIYGYRKSI